ncbi:MAG: HAD family hydrolase [Pseudomonadales bacterium]
MTRRNAKPPPPPAAIIWDLDDTLIADDIVSESTWQHVCRAHARELPDTDAVLREILAVRAWYWADAERHRTGRNNLLAARHWIVETALANLSLKDRSLATAIADSFTQTKNRMLYLLPGATEVLDLLQTQGIPMVLVTNGSADRQWEKINRFSLAGYFDAIFVEGDSGFGKPDQRVYKLAQQALDRPPESIWSIGDNADWDVVGPMRQGMIGIWHDWRQQGWSRNAPEPHASIHGLIELRSLLRASTAIA